MVLIWADTLPSFDDPLNITWSALDSMLATATLLDQLLAGPCLEARFMTNTGFHHILRRSFFIQEKLNLIFGNPANFLSFCCDLLSVHFIKDLQLNLVVCPLTDSFY